MRRLSISLAVALWLLTTASHSLGQGAGSEGKSQAEVLFDQGLADMDAGNYEKACPALAESYRLEPLAGALFTLAECEAERGRIATAVSHYRAFLTRVERMEARRKVRQKQRADVAKQKIETLEPEVPRLTLLRHDDASSEMVVKRDGETVPAGALGSPILVDPGEHVISVEEPGEKPRSKKLTLPRGDSSELRLDFEPDPSSGDDDDDDDGGSALDGDSMRLGAIVAGGVGLAAGIVSVVTGGITLGHKDTIESHCSGTRCDRTGLDAADAAEVTGVVSTVTLAMAIAGGATFALLWLLAPDDQRAERGAAGWRLSGSLTGGPSQLSPPSGGTLGVAIDW